MKCMPIWAKEAAKRMIDIGMSKRELAEQIGVNYQQMCSVMSGYVGNEYIADRICEHFHIQR